MEGSKLAAAILGEVRRAVVGKDEVLAKVLLAILAGGHILLEDIPGVGKTTMALAFSKALSLRYNRVQFTPDVMPSDITGFTLYNKEAGRMEYQPGAVLCNLFLADELNRANIAYSKAYSIMNNCRELIDKSSYDTLKAAAKELLDAIQKENKENLDAYTPYVEQLCDSICSQYGISIY